MSKKQNASVGKIIREKMGYVNSVESPKNYKEADFERDVEL